MESSALQPFLPIFSAIPAEHVRRPHVFIGTFIHTATQLVSVIQEDMPLLVGTGLREDVLHSYPAVIEALREAEGYLNKSRFITEEKHLEWEDKAPRVYDFLEEMECAYRLAYRRIPSVNSVLNTILESRNSQGGIQELLSLVQLGEANPLPLQRIGFDLSKLSLSRQLAQELQTIYTTAVKQDYRSEAARDMRDRAYTYLDALVADVRAAGRFLFWDRPDMYSRYTRVYHTSSRQKSDTLLLEGVVPHKVETPKIITTTPTEVINNLQDVFSRKDRAVGTTPKPGQSPITKHPGSGFGGRPAPVPSQPQKKSRWGRPDDTGEIELSKF